MPHFKQIFSNLLRFPKFRQRSAANPTVNTAVTYQEPDLVVELAQPSAEFAVDNIQSSTNTSVEGVELYSDDDGDGEYDDEKIKDITEVLPYDLVHKAHINVELQSTECLTETTSQKVDEFDDDAEYEDEDLPEVFSYDLAVKTHIEMIIDRLYIAVSDNHREIAALRTRQHERFSHIVRVAIDPVACHENIAPSSWTSEEIHPDDEDDEDDKPDELRLTCPALTLCYNEGLTALSERQLLTARNYIAHSLPNRNANWEREGLVFPCTPTECEDTRVLIVAPTSRSVDVMAILICYMAFLTGTEAGRLLGGLKRLPLIHSHWKGDIVGKESLEMARAASKQKW